MPCENIVGIQFMVPIVHHVLAKTEVYTTLALKFFIENTRFTCIRSTRIKKYLALNGRASGCILRGVPRDIGLFY